jgi:hypothetical protein
LSVARANGIGRRLQTAEGAEVPFIGADRLVGLADLLDEADVRLTVGDPVEMSLRLLSIRPNRSKFPVAALIYTIGPTLVASKRGAPFLGRTIKDFARMFCSRLARTGGVNGHCEGFGENAIGVGQMVGFS